MRSDLVATRDNPLPDGAQCEIARTSDGVAIRVASFRATSGPARGTLLLAQGRAEYIEKYFETIDHFRARGLNVVTFDWRGQGGSQRPLRHPLKGHVGSIAEYWRDIEAVFARIDEAGLPRPLFLLAHSMGAAIVLTYLAGHRSPISRAALCAPMIAISSEMAPRYAGAAARALRFAGMGAMFVPGGGTVAIAAKPFEGNRLCSDPRRYARNRGVLVEAPDLAIGDPTVGWLDTACRAMGQLADPSFPRRITTPLLILASGADRVVATRATERFASRLKTGEAIIIPGARHELLMEADLYRDQALAALDAFIPGGVDARQTSAPREPVLVTR